MDHSIGLPLRAPALPRRLLLAIDAPALVAWVTAFSIVTYLALKDGGYDTIVRSEVGVAIWWTVLLLALSGLVRVRVSRAGWLAIGLLTAFALWTAIAATWSENPESSVVELGRLAGYLGVLVLTILVLGRAGPRSTINGIAAAIGLISLLAVLSRLHPAAFPADAHFQFLGPGSVRKLSYPLNYWNGLAAFAAIGLPLLMAIAVGGRTLAGRALATAALPVCALCVYLTVSRGGVLEAGVGLAIFMAAVPRRLEAAATLLTAAAGSALLVAAASHHPAVTAGIPSAAETAQGTELLWLGLLVCAGVGSLSLAISLAAQHLHRPRLLRPGRRRTAQLALSLALVAVLAAVAGGVPSSLAHAWHDFKQPNGAVATPSQTTVFNRLQAANGNGRYQLWQAAWQAARGHPWTGIGPGTFQFWWARHATEDGFVRNAHSLYLETLAETGIPGAILLYGLLVFFAGAAVARLLRGPEHERLWVAAATAALATFLVAAALEWVWQLAAIASVALMLGAVIVVGRGVGAGDSSAAPRSAQRIGLALMAAVALGAVLVPLAGALAIRASQTAAGRGGLATAYADSLAAQRLEPYAESPRLQEALVLEAAGDLGPAAAAAQAATVRGATDWTAWLTLARIDARRGATAQALSALDRAQRLNPRSPLFAHS